MRVVASISISGDTGLKRFMEKARAQPMLSAEEEYRLAGLASAGDERAITTLASAHLRLVVKMAWGFRFYGLPVDEMVSEGNLGLLDAISRFDRERGFRLSTYAMWWIRAAITEYVVRNFSLVKFGMGADQKRIFFNLRREKARLGELSSGDLHPDDVKTIARALGVSEEAVVAMNRRLAGDSSLNSPYPGDDGEGSEWIDRLPDEAGNQEDMLAASDEAEWRRRMLDDAMVGLNERERRILVARRLEDEAVTLEELSQEFGVSRERIRQIEVRALQKVQAAMAVSTPATRNDLA